jgi:predicted DNA-binding protein (UPF0251 family)
MPSSDRFGPLYADESQVQIVLMTVDEYEAIRLIDLQNLNQEDCAKQMNVARTTVQSIYIDARKKLADCLVNGKILRIEGGNYQLCSGHELTCHCGVCQRYRCEEDTQRNDRETTDNEPETENNGRRKGE